MGSSNFKHLLRWKGSKFYLLPPETINFHFTKENILQSIIKKTIKFLVLRAIAFHALVKICFWYMQTLFMLSATGDRRRIFVLISDHVIYSSAHDVDIMGCWYNWNYLNLRQDGSLESFMLLMTSCHPTVLIAMYILSYIFSFQNCIAFC